MRVKLDSKLKVLRVSKFYILNLGSFLYVTQISIKEVFKTMYTLLFTYLWLCWVFIGGYGLFLVVVSRGLLFVVAQLKYGMWRLPRHGIKPVSTTLAGRSLTSGPLQRSSI